MTATILPNAKNQFFNAAGVPLAGGFVYFYIPNTSTPKATWQNAAQTILNTNPIVLDASGEAIIYGSGTYRQVVYDANNNLIWDQLTASTDGLTPTQINVIDYGAIADARSVLDIVCTSGSPTATSATANFNTNAKVGQTIKIYDIANSVYVFLGTILKVVNNTTITLSGNAAASTISSNAIAYWGTDNATSINNALIAAAALIQQQAGGANSPTGAGYYRVVFPGNGYLFASTLTTYPNVLIDADAMLFSAVGNGISDRTWAIQCSNSIQISRLLLEVGGGMGIINGTMAVTNSSFINQLQIWNVGINYNGALSPTSQTALELLGFDYTITKYWSKSGNLGIYLNNVSDVRMDLPEIIGAVSGMQIQTCENVQINKFTLDTCEYIGITIDGSHNIFINGNIFSSVNGTGLTYGVTVGLNDTFDINRNIRIALNAQRCGGTLTYVAYCQDSAFDLLGSNSANYSGGGVPINTMVTYGSGCTGMLRIDSVRDTVTSGAGISNYTGSRYGTFADYYNNNGTQTLHFIGTFTNP